MYSQKVMDYFSNPKNVGIIEDADGIGETGSPVCGDIMKIYLKIEDRIIKDAKFKTFGCGSAIASSSIATEMIIGKTVDEAAEFTNSDFVKALGGLPSAKVHCSMLAEQTIKVALLDYCKKNNIEIESLKDFKIEDIHEH